jgi:hypothetical protein
VDIVNRVLFIKTVLSVSQISVSREAPKILLTSECLGPAFCRLNPAEHSNLILIILSLISIYINTSTSLAGSFSVGEYSIQISHDSPFNT